MALFLLFFDKLVQSRSTHGSADLWNGVDMEKKDSLEGTNKSGNLLENLLERNSLNRRLHWTTIASEKALLALIGLLTLVATFKLLMTCI